MDLVSIRLLRAALVWLVIGFALGGLILSDASLPGDWRLWLTPTHGHILFVGWFFQFAIGVGYWLLPRRRSPERPLGYHAGAAHAALTLLNLGLVLRIVGEPAFRTGHTGVEIDLVLGVSAVLQFGAAVIVATQFWRRVIPRQPRASTAREPGRATATSNDQS
jgi:hypothetical protein